MRKLILSTGLCMTALTLSVFLGWHVVAEPDAQGDATAGEISPSSERRAKMTAGPNANARLLLERLAEGEAKHSADDGIGRAKMTADHNAECSKGFGRRRFQSRSKILGGL